MTTAWRPWGQSIPWALAASPSAAEAGADAHTSREQNGTTELNSCTPPFWARRLRFNYRQANWMGFKRARDRRGRERKKNYTHYIFHPLWAFQMPFQLPFLPKAIKSTLDLNAKLVRSLKRGRRKTNANVRAKIDCDKCISIKRDGVTWHGKWIALEIQTARHSLLLGDRRYIKRSFNRSMFKTRLNFYGGRVWC